MSHFGGLLAGLLLATGTGWPAEARPLRVMSLDQCADQYVLALAPGAELALSPRADAPDAFMAHAAAGHPKMRPSLEAAVAFRPDVVVRYWGGDARLMRRLTANGVTVVSIDDAHDFAGIAANVRRVGHAVRGDEQAQTLVQEMSAKLSAAEGAGRGRKAVYLTTSGMSAGPDTLIDAILRAAGFENAVTRSGFAMPGLEKLLLSPPALFVRGFFEHAYMDRRGTGRHPALAALMGDRIVASLPATTLTCPAWFAADAVTELARGN